MGFTGTSHPPAGSSITWKQMMAWRLTAMPESGHSSISLTASVTQNCPLSLPQQSSPCQSSDSIPLLPLIGRKEQWQLCQEEEVWCNESPWTWKRLSFGVTNNRVHVSRLWNVAAQRLSLGRCRRVKDSPPRHQECMEQIVSCSHPP